MACAHGPHTVHRAGYHTQAEPRGGPWPRRATRRSATPPTACSTAALEHPGQLRDRPPAAGAAPRRRGTGARPAGVGREAVPGLERRGARRRGLRLGAEGALRLRAADHRHPPHGGPGTVLRPGVALLRPARPAAGAGSRGADHRGERRPGRAPRPPRRAHRGDRRLLLARQAGGGHRLHRRGLDPGHRLGPLPARHLRHPAVRRLHIGAQHLQPLGRQGDGAVHRQRLPGGLGEFVAKANEYLVFETAPPRP